MNATGCVNNRGFCGTSWRLSVAAFCTLALLCAPYTYGQQTHVVQQTVPPTDMSTWSRDDLINAKTVSSEFDSFVAHEMLQSSYSASMDVVAAPSYGKATAPAMVSKTITQDLSVERTDPKEGHDDPYTNTLDQAAANPLLEAFTSLLVNMVQNEQQAPEKQATTFQEYDALADENEQDEDLTRADKTWPFMTVGALFFQDQQDQWFRCTASVVRARLVLTAAECVHNGNGNDSGKFKNFLFIPAFKESPSASELAPFGAWGTTGRSWLLEEWISGGGGLPRDDDYAILEMADKQIEGEAKRIGDIVGYLGWAVNHLTFDDQWAVTHGTTLGYPSDINGIPNTPLEMRQINSGLQPYVYPDGTRLPKVYIIGSDWGKGIAGAPVIKEFGWTRDENGNRVINPNWVLGVVSFGFSDPQIMADGVVELDERWHGLLKSACEVQAGNC